MAERPMIYSEYLARGPFAVAELLKFFPNPGADFKPEFFLEPGGKYMPMVYIGKQVPDSKGLPPLPNDFKVDKVENGQLYLLVSRNVNSDVPGLTKPEKDIRVDLAPVLWSLLAKEHKVDDPVLQADLDDLNNAKDKMVKGTPHEQLSPKLKNVLHRAKEILGKFEKLLQKDNKLQNELRKKEEQFFKNHQYVVNEFVKDPHKFNANLRRMLAVVRQDELNNKHEKEYKSGRGIAKEGPKMGMEIEISKEAREKAKSLIKPLDSLQKRQLEFHDKIFKDHYTLDYAGRSKHKMFVPRGHHWFPLIGNKGKQISISYKYFLGLLKAGEIRLAAQNNPLLSKREIINDLIQHPDNPVPFEHTDIMWAPEGRFKAIVRRPPTKGDTASQLVTNPKIRRQLGLDPDFIPKRRKGGRKSELEKKTAGHEQMLKTLSTGMLIGTRSVAHPFATSSYTGNAPDRPGTEKIPSASPSSAYEKCRACADRPDPAKFDLWSNTAAAKNCTCYSDCGSENCHPKEYEMLTWQDLLTRMPKRFDSEKYWSERKTRLKAEKEADQAAAQKAAEAHVEPIVQHMLSALRDQEKLKKKAARLGVSPQALQKQISSKEVDAAAAEKKKKEADNIEQSIRIRKYKEKIRQNKDKKE